MNTGMSEREGVLRQQRTQSEESLQRAQAERAALDNELAALAKEKDHYATLSTACEALRELARQDAAHLFWGDKAGHDSVERQLEQAQSKIDAFSARVDALQSRQQSVVESIDEHHDSLDNLFYALKDLAAYEESKRQEWEVERETDGVPYYAQVMPWSRGCEEDKRFMRSLGGSVMASLVLAVLIGTVALPIVERSESKKVPERVAKIVRQARLAPPPQPEPQPVAEAVPEPEAPPEPQAAPQPQPELVPEAPAQPSPEPVQMAMAQAAPKEPAKPKGLLAFRSSIANRAQSRPTAQLGARAQLSSAGENAVSRAQRSMVSTAAPGSSGGINLADISRNVGGGGGGGQGIDGVQVSRVASSIGSGSGPARPRSGGASAGRTDEEIQIVFDRYKASLYRMYNRELRKNPTLRGQLVLRMTIEPDGSVSFCELQTSDMNAPALSQRIVDRVLTFDFGAKPDIVSMTIIYPIDFLPAA